MRKRYAAYVLIVAGLLVIIYFRFREKSTRVRITPGGEMVSNDARSSTESTRSNTETASQIPLVPEVSAGISNDWQQLYEKARPAIENFSQQLHKPIEFYGKVVDENEQPVSGATVVLGWTHFIMPATSDSTNVTSGADGTFQFRGVEGATLRVNVSKDGYYPMSSANARNFSYSENFGATPFRPDPSNPVFSIFERRG